MVTDPEVLKEGGGKEGGKEGGEGGGVGSAKLGDGSKVN